MSSTISTSQVKTLPVKMVEKLRKEERPARLVRTSSMEKFRKLNSYICSQHFFILPALFNWLKSSHSGFHAQKESTVNVLRSLIFNTAIYTFCLNQIKQISLRDVWKFLELKLVAGLVVLHKFYGKLDESVIVLNVVVYTAVVLVFAKLFLCIYLLTSVYIPIGLYFLLACLSYINLLYFRTLTHYKCKNKKD